MKHSLLDWIEFLPRGIRNAWCELTGGHDNAVCGCWQGDERATQISLYCQRCSKQTRWYPVPLKKGWDLGEHEGCGIDSARAASAFTNGMRATEGDCK